MVSMTHARLNVFQDNKISQIVETTFDLNQKTYPFAVITTKSVDIVFDKIFD